MNFFKNKIKVSMLVVVVFFVVFLVALYFAKPLYVTEISKQGKKKISYPLLVSVSLLFGIFFGTVTFFLFPGENGARDPSPISKESPVHRFVNYNL